MVDFPQPEAPTSAIFEVAGMCISKLSSTYKLRDGYWKFTFSNLISPSSTCLCSDYCVFLTSRVDFSSITVKIFFAEALALEIEGILAIETPAPIVADMRTLIDK